MSFSFEQLFGGFMQSGVLCGQTCDKFIALLSTGKITLFSAERVVKTVKAAQLYADKAAVSKVFIEGIGDATPSNDKEMLECLNKMKQVVSRPDVIKDIDNSGIHEYEGFQAILGNMFVRA